ncbi:hypothetical protein [Zoogloea sp. LCSB751]|uniref:hypothetical protein n=1 Tax=Zoogloea sp. LCSB751 TaxID=1965277 RepID=UPI0009A50163|nr:hypothetical protein [Zoogloea sp. LCSB751]
MTELQRLTTEYVDLEDRIRLSGESAPGEAEVVWLTRRLVDRLVPHLCAWLEKQGGMGLASEDAGVADALQGFALQAALQSLVPQPPVAPEQARRSWLVQSVDVTAGDDALQLVFRGEDDARVSLVLQAQALRQWLGILHAQCVAGGWPLEAWPSWLAEPIPAGTPPAMVLH